MIIIKTLLAIETATEICSIALLKDNAIFVLEEKTPKSHGQVILTLIENLTQQNNVRLTDVDALAFGKGPGAFTGLRIGIGVVQGLAFGLNCLTIPVSTLQALAQTAFLRTGASFILTALDARMGEVYFGAFSVVQGVAIPLLEECVLKPEQVRIPDVSKKWVAVGSGYDQYRKVLKKNQKEVEHIPSFYPSAEAIAKLGILEYENGKAVSAEKAQPVYLRLF